MRVIQTLRAKLLGSTLARSLSRRVKQFAIRRSINRLLAKGHPVKIIIGAGSTSFVGWISTDLPVLNALIPSDWRFAVPRSSVSRMLLEHVVEHWCEKDLRLFLRIAKRAFHEGGFMRIAVPDGLHPEPLYIEAVRPGGIGCGAADHKVLYTHRTLARALSEENYAFQFLEYFDENAQFHRSDWELEDGYVERSAAHDSRNKAKSLSYTSLIVDAWPDRNVSRKRFC